MASPDFSFSKKEKLCSQKVIEELFSSGRSFIKYTLRVVFMPKEDQSDTHVKVLVSVSKRRFKRAYKRNLLKRRIREAYRLNKHLIFPLLEKNRVDIAIAFVYLPTEILPYGDIEKAMTATLDSLKTKLSLE
jgi:ribonuclease P protein component